MRALIALALAALCALPAGTALTAAAPSPPAGPSADAAEPVLFLRRDPDGNRTLVLWLEDDPAGTYRYSALPRPPAQSPFDEVGTYLHPWTFDGKPEVTVGLYAIHETEGLVRFPRVILEHAPDDAGFARAVQDAVLTDAAGMAQSLNPFFVETLAPDLQDYGQGNLGFANFRQHPTVVAWHARRALPGIAEAWLGTYVARDGAVQQGPGFAEGWRSMEVGMVLRQGLADQRLAGAWMEQRATFTQGAEDRAARSEVTAGARTPGGRVPLVTLTGEDQRVGTQLSDPASQSSGITLGVHGPDGYVPVAGLRTEVEQRFHGQGVEVERTTAAGVFVDGQWRPLAGLRYHADRVALLDLPFELVEGGGLGSNNTGDAELSIGAYPMGTYEPLAQVTLDDTFAGASMPHRTMVSVGVFTPVRYQPLASVTYEGTDSLLDWVARVQGNRAKGAEWLVSAGPWAGQLYVPLVGVRFRGDAPGTTQPHEAEVAVGTFIAGYTAFLPLVAVHASSQDTFAAMATRLATEGLGNNGGNWNAGAGVYAPGEGFVPLVDVRYTRVQDPEDPRSGDLDVLLAGQPALGVQYRGQKALVPSFNQAQNLGDDSAWRAAVGAHTPVGFVPLARVYHDGTGTTVLLGPDVEV